jgi:hypothetical protein
MRFLKSGIYIFFAFLLTASLFYMSACSDDDDIFNRNTSFNIGITDVPCTELFTEVNMTFSSFKVVPSDLEGNPTGDEIELVPEPPLTLNILDYINPNVFTLPFQVLPGTYKLVSLTIDAIEIASDTLDPAQVDAINDMLLQFMPLEVIFGDTAPNVIFTVPEGMDTTVVIDINCSELLLEGEGVYYIDTENLPIEVVDIIHQ